MLEQKETWRVGSVRIDRLVPQGSAQYVWDGMTFQGTLKWCYGSTLNSLVCSRKVLIISVLFITSIVIVIHHPIFFVGLPAL